MMSLIKKQKKDLDNNNGDKSFFSVISGRRAVSILCFVALVEVMSPLMLVPSRGCEKAVVYVSGDKEAINTNHTHRHHNKTVSFARKFEKQVKQCSRPRDMAPTKEILIYGERHHGTNFARSVILENALPSITCERDQHHGWKHGPLVPPKANFKKNELLLVITRGVFSWLPKMHKETYCYNKGENLPFSDFIRSGYTCRPHEGKNLTETAANIVRIRTRKYKNWLTRNPDYFNFDAKPKFCTRVHLRYESIIEDGQENTIGKILKGYGIDKKGYFKPIKKRAGPRGAIGKEYNETDFKREAIEVLSKYSLEDLQFVLENLDLEFETNVLNYNYDYVLEYIEQETAKLRDKLSVRGKSN
mmetsp:Transcript_4642/g.6869  ORF Transcript_4642/g.6869 Transcript_4642/m.6869 type:complete len:359 (-) Transcript_4642:153-1229(-)